MEPRVTRMRTAAIGRPSVRAGMARWPIAERKTVKFNASRASTVRKWVTTGTWLARSLRPEIGSHCIQTPNNIINSLFETALFDLKTVVHSQRLKYAAQQRNRSQVFAALGLV